jgi:hypothetical protein
VSRSAVWSSRLRARRGGHRQNQIGRGDGRFAEAAGFFTHRGLVLDFGVGKGQDPIRALLLSLLGLTPSSEAESRHRAAERLVTDGAVAPERLVFLHDLLDLPQTGEWRTLYDAMDNTARNRGKRELAAALVARGCGGGPMLIIVEDLHWADPQVLGHLAAFATAVANGPGLLVMTSRVGATRLTLRGAQVAVERHSRPSISVPCEGTRH